MGEEPAQTIENISESDGKGAETAHIRGAMPINGSGSDGFAKMEKGRLTVCGVEFVYLYFLTIPASFIGWLIESAAKIYQTGAAHTHLLPFIAPYGLCVFAFHLLLGNPDDLSFFGKRLFRTRSRKSVFLSNVISLSAMVAGSFLGELVVGNGTELLFGVKLWDYSFQKLHLTPYVGLTSTLGFGLGGYLAFRYVYTPSLAYVRKNVKFKRAKIINLTLGLLILADSITLILQIIILHKAPNYMVIKFR